MGNQGARQGVVMSSEIVKFYRGGTNKNGLSLEDMWEFNYNEMEHIHNYIQWMFPMVEPEYWNRDTPKLTDEDVKVFKRDKAIMDRVAKSFAVILEFWGFRVVVKDGIIVVEPGDNYKNRSEQWQTGMNHNFLRVTRVLHCLNDLGLRKMAKAFHQGLVKAIGDNPKGFNATSIDCWNNAMVKDMKGRGYGKETV